MSKKYTSISFGYNININFNRDFPNKLTLSYKSNIKFQKLCHQQVLCHNHDSFFDILSPIVEKESLYLKGLVENSLGTKYGMKIY